MNKIIEVLKKARREADMRGKRTVEFIDEAILLVEAEQYAPANDPPMKMNRATPTPKTKRDVLRARVAKILNKKPPTSGGA